MRNGRVSRVEGGGGNFNKSPKWTPMSSSRPSGLPQFHGNARLFHPDLFYTRCIIEDKPQTFICEQRVKKIQCRCPPVYDANLISNNTNFVFNHSLYYNAHRSKKTFFFIFHKCQALLFYILIDMLEKVFCSNITPFLGGTTYFTMLNE